MAWKITIGDKSMLLDDLSQEDFMEALKDFPELSWLRVYYSPGAHPGAFYNLLAVVARKLDEPVPDRPKNMKETIALLSHVEEVDDDRPTQWSESALPLEEAAGTETTTSSTSIEPEAGIQT